MCKTLCNYPLKKEGRAFRNIACVQTPAPLSKNRRIGLFSDFYWGEGGSVHRLSEILVKIYLIITGVQASGANHWSFIATVLFLWSEIAGPHSSGNFNDWPLKITPEAWTPVIINSQCSSILKPCINLVCYTAVFSVFAQRSSHATTLKTAV